MRVVITICTKRRIDSLLTTLQAISSCEMGSHDVQCLIIANENCGTTKSALTKFQSSTIPLELIECDGSIGKAKNAGLQHILDKHPADTFIIFTDDDTTPSVDWIINFTRAAVQIGDKHIYGGQIIPALDDKELEATFNFLLETKFAPPLFAKYSPEACSGPTKLIPFGPNFGFFLSSLENQRFPEDIGFGSTHPMLGEETEFLQAFICRGYKIHYVEDAVVEHRLRTEQLGKRWLLNRALFWARSMAVHYEQYKPKNLNKTRRYRIRLWGHSICKNLLILSKKYHLYHCIRVTYYEELLREISRINNRKKATTQ